MGVLEGEVVFEVFVMKDKDGVVVIESFGLGYVVFLFVGVVVLDVDLVVVGVVDFGL